VTDTDPMPPGATSLRSHVTVPPENVPPLLAETNATPAGSVSVNRAFSATPAPILFQSSTKVTIGEAV
jgi:hypothetical protein